MNLYIGLDLGTSGMKGVLTDSGLKVLKTASTASPLIRKGKWREFDADDFCVRAFGLIRELAAGTDGGSIRALSVASASGNTLFLDEENRPMGNVISWTDRRLTGLEDEYLQGFNLAGVHEMTGWPYIGMFPLAHIAWVKKERPEMFKKSKTLSMSTEYLLFRLCGRWGTDPSTATPFYLLDQMEGTYCEEYIRYFGLNEKILPKIIPSRTVLGTIGTEASGRTGLETGVKVVLGSFDHPACARGMGALQSGDLLISCGTSWAGLFVSPDREKAVRAGLLVDPYLREKGLWACMFAMTQYGDVIDSAVKMLIDDSENRFDTLSRLAMEKADCRRELSLLGDGTQSALWRGLSREQAAYGIMQAACTDAKKGIDELKMKGFAPERILMAGGPAKSEIWPQVMANTFQKDVYCLHREFGGAVGAALMAMIGDGKYRDEEDFFRNNEAGFMVYRPE